MAQNTTAVSFAGNPQEVKALKLIAAARSVSMGKLVRDALYAQYGTEIANAINQLPPFFASAGTELYHNESEDTNDR